MRKIFEIISLVDWITPVAAFVEDVVEGGPLNLDAWTFFIPYNTAVTRGWSEVHIEELLSHYGVRTWGGLVNFGEFSFSVKLEQAAWAEYILTSYKIPVHQRSLGAPRAPKRREPASERRQQGQRDPLSFLDDLWELLFPPPLS